MIKSQIKAALLSAATIALAGCVDDNYDLSNYSTPEFQTGGARF